MSRGIDCELTILREIASQRRIPRAMKRAMRERPWLLDESGVTLPTTPALVPSFFLAGAAAFVVAIPTLSYAQQFMSYTVRPGDTLSTIAARHLGASWRWKELHAANPNIRNAALIFPGQVIRLSIAKIPKGKALPVAKSLNPAMKAPVQPRAAQTVSQTPVQPHAQAVPQTPVQPQTPQAVSQVQPQPLQAPVHREPFWPILLRILDILSIPLALFGARQIHLRRRPKKVRRARRIIPLPRTANAPAFWEYPPGTREAYNFLAGR